MIVNEISLVIQNKNDIRKLMADKKTKESSKEDYNGWLAHDLIVQP
jgi:hypothetical protein